MLPTRYVMRTVHSVPLRPYGISLKHRLKLAVGDLGIEIALCLARFRLLTLCWSGLDERNVPIVPALKRNEEKEDEKRIRNLVGSWTGAGNIWCLESAAVGILLNTVSFGEKRADSPWWAAGLTLGSRSTWHQLLGDSIVWHCNTGWKYHGAIFGHDQSSIFWKSHISHFLQQYVQLFLQQWVQQHAECK